ncbi:MAG: hypothetical protein NT068_02275 [Candidatus Nomurabacteria bacterium]|nr:hypothetical protein [Candidatus Nomurabacteria bacterium]
MQKLSKKSLISLVVIILLIFLGLYFSRDSITKQWKEFQLNKEFVCPENQTAEQADAYRYKQTKFYVDNYPDITFQNFLSRRMQLLVSHKCSVTLQNLANDNNGVLPDQNSVNELKNAPYGPNNLTLKEMAKNLK